MNISTAQCFSSQPSAAEIVGTCPAILQHKHQTPARALRLAADFLALRSTDRPTYRLQRYCRHIGRRALVAEDQENDSLGLHGAGRLLARRGLIRALAHEKILGAAQTTRQNVS